LSPSVATTARWEHDNFSKKWHHHRKQNIARVSAAKATCAPQFHKSKTINPEKFINLAWRAFGTPHFASNNNNDDDDDGGGGGGGGDDDDDDDENRKQNAARVL